MINTGSTRNLIQQIGNKIGKTDLPDYEVYTQVQFYYGSGNDFFIADQVLIKYNNNVPPNIIDIVILENKLSQSTRLSKNQRAAADFLVNNNISIATRNLRTRSKESLPQRFRTYPNIIQNNTFNKNSITKFVKVYSDGNNNFDDIEIIF